jgi:glycosyltransferase involved in cell wall biosynthesis
MNGKFLSYKILFLCKWYPNRNDLYQGIFIRNHANALSKHCNLAVIYVGGSNLSGSNTYEIEISEEAGLKEIKVYYQNSLSLFNPFDKLIKAFRYFRALWMGINIYRKEFGRPHLIHVHVLTRPAIFALIFKRIKKIPYIITEHFTGYMPQHNEYEGYFKKWFDKIIVKEAAAITTVSSFLQKSMLNHGLIGNYKIVPNVISPGPAKPDHKLLKAINISDMVDEMKNISGLINATAEILKDYPEFILEIIGQGKDRLKLEAQAVSLGIKDKNLFFLDPVPNKILLEKIASSSFLVVNSRYESFSVVAAEALACGVPVLSTKCGGPEEFIDSEHGLLIETDNQNELLFGIKFMIKNHSKFDPEKLRKYALERFGEESICNSFLDLYHHNIEYWNAGNSEDLIKINPEWKVLDVGSGNRPNHRADVLLEKELEETEHRSGVKAVIPKGKKLVVGDALEMPFADKEFEYVIASHIAEHIDEPGKFCRELMRVGKRGYIETPGKFSEKILNEPFHKWVVFQKNGELVFEEKTNYNSFSEKLYSIYYLNESRTGHRAYFSNSKILIFTSGLIHRIFRKIPGAYTKFKWEGDFKYRIIRKKSNV